MKDVQIHRFVVGVHLAGILLAGVALGWVLQTASALAGRGTPRYAAAVAAPLAVAAVVLLLPWIDRYHYDAHGGVLIRAQQADDKKFAGDLDTLVDIVKASGDGRVYSGTRANWGKDYKLSFAPVYEWFAYRDVDALGFTFRTLPSLSNDVEASFDETNPAQYEMYNVRYLILPADRKPAVPARQIAASGNNVLYEVKTTGYTQVIDRAAAVTADRTNLNDATSDFRGTRLASRGIYPGVAFAGGAVPLQRSRDRSRRPGRRVACGHRTRGSRTASSRRRFRRTAAPSSCSRRPTTRAGRRPSTTQRSSR